MSYTDVDAPMYYPENYDYSIYYQNEIKKNQSPVYTASMDSKGKKPIVHPTINYLNERKCPIYVHNIRRDSSVYNNYNQKFTSPRKPVDNQKAQKPAPQIASKFVLDKLEETYWATWKPKKENEPVNKLKSPRKLVHFGYADSKPVFQEHNTVPKKDSNRPHGDVTDNVIKYFKAKHFNSSSTTNSVQETNQRKVNNTLVPKRNEIVKSQRDTVSKETVTSDGTENKRDKRLNRPSNSRRLRVTKQEPISQEIQTEVHCPVILEESKEGAKDSEESVIDPEHNEEKYIKHNDTIEDLNRRNSEEVRKQMKQKGKGKKLQKESKQSKTKKQEMQVITETDNNSDNMNAFVEHKDSIEITKKKQEKSGPKEHFQQPKCIRLYRKSGLAAGYIKGGTYPLKSCLKKEGYPKGNFRLGAPGSPLFVTSSSFSNRKRK